MLLASPFQVDANLLLQFNSSDTSQLTVPAEYSERLAYYQRVERWYTGKALEEKDVDKSGKEYDLYPLRFNPFPAIVAKHVEAVMGIASPGALPVRPYILGSVASSDEADKVQTVLRQLLHSAGGGSGLQDAIRRSEVYGGSLMRAIMRGPRLVWEHIHPKAFFVVPNSSWTSLSEMWIVRTIGEQEAREIYGVELQDGYDFGVYVEHWTTEQIEATIDDMPVRRPDRQELNGPNPYGFIPAVYIPHMRGVDYWGISLIEAAIGLVREINARLSDIGKAVALDAEEIIAMRNSTSPRVRDIAGRIVLDLGTSSGMNASANPDMFVVGGGSHNTSEPMMNYINELFSQVLRVTDTPPVAFGDDEGSQRSSMTLEMRFWPLLSHANEERRAWSEGLTQLSRMSLKMMEYHGLSSYTDSDILEHINWRWDEQLPRDVKTITDAAVARVQNGLGAPIDLLGLFPDVRDPAEAERHIREWMIFQASLKQLAGSGQSAKKQDAAADRAQENQQWASKNKP